MHTYAYGAPFVEILFVNIRNYLNLHTEFYNRLIAGGIDKLVNLIDRSISIVKLRILIEKVVRI